MKRKGLKTALATIICIFNLFVCFSGVMAWFAASNKNEAAGMQVKMATHELDLDYHIYKYDDDQKEAVDVTDRADALTLQKYDSVITSRNENTPIIVELIITGMKLGDNIPLYLNTQCTDTSTTTRSLSNIIQLQFSPINSISSVTANDIYYEAVDYFDTNSVSELTFKNGDNKSTNILYTLNNYTLDNGSLRFFIKIDYSISLIEDFEFSITDLSTTSFTNDLTLIECYTDEN